jgi:hypothetical protein
MAELYARGRVLLGGPFLDDAGGGLALQRAKGRDEATALLGQTLAAAGWKEFSTKVRQHKKR